MISANEAREQQNQNIENLITLATDEISKKIKDAINRANEEKVIHFHRNKKISDMIANRFRDHGYDVEINRSADPRDGTMYQLTIKW